MSDEDHVRKSVRKSVAFDVGGSSSESGGSNKSAGTSRKSVTITEAERDSVAIEDEEEAEDVAAGDGNRPRGLTRSLTLSLRKPKDEAKEAEELSRSMTMAARKARGDLKSPLKAGAQGMARTLSMKPGSAKPRRAELNAAGIELELSALCSRWDVSYTPSPGIESPEELLERHSSLRAECAAAKEKHCAMLLQAHRARVAEDAKMGPSLDGQLVSVLAIEKRGKEVYGLLVRASGGKGNIAVEAHHLRAVAVAGFAGTEIAHSGFLEADGADGFTRAEGSGSFARADPSFARAGLSFARAAPSFAPGGGRPKQTSIPPSMATWARGVSSMLGINAGPRSPPPPPAFEASDPNVTAWSCQQHPSQQIPPSAKLLTTIKGGRIIWRRVVRSLREVPAMPMPVALADVLMTASPRDASCLERQRDRILAFFAQPCVVKTTLFIAVLVAVNVVVFGLIIVWAVLGLFLGVPNGWGEFKQECLDLAAQYNQTLGPQSIPTPPNSEWGWSQHSPVEDCTLNQLWFNRCIKVFT